MFDAIGIIADSIVKKYQYDKTIEAKIISTAQKDKGIYKVEYENAIFDAYSSDTQSFYENETVYVSIPQGDFSKQKHIIGRKIDTEKAPDKVFNFKMPFDNFVGLQDLTKESPYAYGKKGFLANYPEHGKASEIYAEYTEAVEPYRRDLNTLEETYNQSIDAINTTVDELSDIVSELSLYATGYVIGEHPFGATTYLGKLCESLEANEQADAINILNQYKIVTGQTGDLVTLCGTKDKEEIDAAIAAYRDKALAELNESYNNERTRLLDELQTIMSSYNNESHNHLWSWDNTDHEILLESTMGIQVDVETLLGDYFPISGDYGLRIVITGTAKATATEPTRTVTEEIIWTNQQMYGNTYAFYTPYPQQRMLDVSNYISLEHIDIFFYQDHNFKDYRRDFIPYIQDGQFDSEGKEMLYPPNIYYDNLQVLLGITTEECKNDRVLLYTHNNLTYGESMYAPEQAEENEKELVLAWVHKVDDSAVLVDRRETDMTSSAETNRTLEFYNANIYWYHFEYGVPQDTSDIRWRYAGPNWKYLSEFDNQFKINVIPNFDMPREQWKAVVVYNGVPYMSDPIEFTNFDSTLDEKMQDQTNEVIFRLLREKLDGEGHYTVQEDNNLTNFFVYDENNMCIKNDENVRWADLNYYIQVWIRNNEYGTYVPLPLAIDTDNWDNNSFEVEWQYPTTSTMLEYFQPIEDADLANAALAPTNDTMSESFIEAIKKCTRKFRIRDRWDMRYINNTVAAIVTRGGRTFKPQQEFLFGQSGNMGSKYTVRIVQDEPAAPCMVQGEYFKVRAVVFDDKNIEVNSRHFVFSWKLLAPTIITEGANTSIDDKNWKECFATVNAGDEGNNNIKNVLAGYIRNDYPPVFEVTVRGVDDYPIKTVQGFKLIDNSELNTNYRINVPNKVEFKSDGKAPITINSNFEVYRIVEDAEDQQLHPEWELHQMTLNSRDEWNENNPVEYIGLKSTLTPNIEIPTNNNPVLYWNPPNFDQGYSLEPTVEFPNDLQHTNDYRSIKNQLDQWYENTSQTSGSSYENQQELLDLYNTRLSQLNLVVNKLIPSYNSYCLDPYINYTGGSAIPWEWEDGLTENYYTTIGFTDGSFYFKQAIPFSKNTYSSSLLNTWNGSVTIDEDNGAVLSQMIAAGAKDGNNRFTGVVMGDWANYADNSLDTPGLYGFKYGDQVFGFKTDGTGFIGKSGKGRIEFDGNKSIISNSDQTCYINLDPVVYNSDGFLNNYNGFSSYFLYSQVPRTSTASIIGEDDLEQSAFWTSKFMNDPLHDYFIVDPNNGVLTTGGVIARYGKIGNWMISQAGLYQKHTDAIPAQNRYMYLGYPSEESNQNIIDEFLTLNERQREDAILSLKTEFINKEFEYIGQFAKMIFQYDPMHYYNYGWPYKRYADIIMDTLIEYYTVQNNFHYEDYDWDTIFENFDLPQIPVTKRQDTWNADDNFLRSLPGDVNPNDYTAYIIGTNGVTEIKYIPIEDIKTKILTQEQVILLGLTKKYIKKHINPETDLYRNLHAHYDFDSEGNIIDKHINQATGGIISNIPSSSEFSYRIFGTLSHIFGYDYENYSLSLEPSDVDELGNYKIAVPTNRSYPITLNFAYRFWTDTDNARQSALYSNPNIPRGLYSSSLEENWNYSYYGSNYDRLLAQGKSVSSLDKWDGQDGYAISYAGLDTDRIPSAYVYDNLSVEGYRYCLKFYQAYHEYHLKAYNRQLQECIAAGLAILSAEQYNAYLKQKALYEADLQKALNDLNKLYDIRATSIASALNKTLENSLATDANKYMIFAGYTPTDKPLFSVNWRGYMTAREGRIGDTSPWYIGDRGLTQKNNSGTIFLGDPQTTPGNLPQDAQGQSYTSIDDNGHYWIIDGPNGGKVPLLNNNTWDGTGTAPVDRGPAMFWWDFTNKQNPTYSIDYGNFAIYAGDTGIRFGVRMDGSFLSTKGNIGGWSIDRTYLATIPSALGYQEYDIGENNAALNPKNMIVLDAGNHQMLFGGPTADTAATVIYGNGAIKLSAHTDGSGQGGMNIGTLDLGGYWLQGITNTSAINIQTGAEDDPENYKSGENSIEGFEFSYAYNHTYKTREWGDSRLVIGGQTVKYTIPAVKPVTMSFTNNIHNLFSVTDHSQDYGNSELGVKLTTGKLSGNSGNALVFYPVGASDATSLDNGLCRAILGTADNPWNLVANHINAGLIETKSIYAGEIYTNGKLLATQEWTMIWIEKLASMIKDVAGTGSGSASGGFSATADVSAGIFDAIHQVYFCAGSENAQRDFNEGKLTLPVMQFTFDSGSGGGENASGDHDYVGSVIINFALTDILKEMEFAETGSEGKIELTLTGWTNTIRKASFNLAATTFYKNNVFRRIATVGNSGVKTAFDSGKRADNGETIGGIIEYASVANPNLVCESAIKVWSDNGELANIKVFMHSDTAYKAGWNAAMKSISLKKGSSGGESLEVYAESDGTGAIEGCNTDISDKKQICYGIVTGIAQLHSSCRHYGGCGPCKCSDEGTPSGGGHYGGCEEGDVRGTGNLKVSLS